MRHVNVPPSRKWLNARCPLGLRMSLVLSVARSPPLGEGEAALLAGLVARGLQLNAAAFSGSPAAPPVDELDRAQRSVFRRWVLEMLLALLERPRGFNELKGAVGGPAAQSLAPKLRGLAGGGLVERSDLGGRPRRTRYALTDAGEDVAAAVFALTHGKSEHMRALAGQGPGPSAARLDAAEPVDPFGLRGATAAYATAARAFMAARLERPRPPGAEGPFATARRLSRACTRKWHAPVLSALAERPRRFSELRGAVLAGPESLSHALRGLEQLRAVERAADGAYRLTPMGAFDLALGGPVVVAAWFAAAGAVHGA